MSDSFFSSPLFIIAAIAIFIIRTIGQFRKKKAPPPPRPHIPVHFEDDVDEEAGSVEFYPAGSGQPGNDRNEERYFPFTASGEEFRPAASPRDRAESAERFFPYAASRGASEYFKDIAAAQTAAPPVKQAVRNAPPVPDVGKAAAGSAISSRPPPAKTAPAGFAEQKNPFNFGRLSPLQQAVVMAEILGPPKSLV